MSQEPEQLGDQDPGSLQHAAEHEKAHKKPSVLTYLVILFAAAFLLMAWSYFMQQRASNETIEGLKESVSAMQSVDMLQQANAALEKRVEELTAQAAELQRQSEALEGENAALQAQTERQAQSAQAMDWFWRIQREVSRGRYSSARTLVERFQASGLDAALPTDHPADADGPSPAEQYQEILDMLY